MEFLRKALFNWVVLGAYRDLEGRLWKMGEDIEKKFGRSEWRSEELEGKMEKVMDIITEMRRKQ